MIRGWILNEPSVDYTLLWDEEMSHFLLGETYVNRVILLKVIVEGISYLWHVVVGHLPKTFRAGLLGQLVHLVEFGLVHFRMFKGEAHVDKLLWVKIAMPVRCSGEGRWKRRARSVDCLPNVFQVDTARHLSDKCGSQSLVSEFLMHAQKVYLGHLDPLSIQVHRDRNSCNESCELALAADTDDPLRMKAWWVESPAQEVDGVIESELTVRVFNVMICKQRVNLLGLVRILKVKIAPLVIVWQLRTVLRDLINTLIFEGAIKRALWDVVPVLWHGLSRPEIVVHEKGQHFFDALDRVLVLSFSELLFELGEELYNLCSAIAWILKVAIKQACLEWVHLYVFETCLHIVGKVFIIAIHKLRGLLGFLWLHNSRGGCGCG